MLLVNRQWGITEAGIEAIEGAPSPDGLTPRYVIPTKRLLETTKRGQDTFYDWPVHMAEKTWVDVSAFREAFEKALRYHLSDDYERIDDQRLQSSFREAQRIAKKDR